MPSFSLMPHSVTIVRAMRVACLMSPPAPFDTPVRPEDQLLGNTAAHAHHDLGQQPRLALGQAVAFRQAQHQAERTARAE